MKITILNNFSGDDKSEIDTSSRTGARKLQNLWTT